MAVVDFLLGVLGSEQKLSANDADFNHSVEDILKENTLAGGNLIRYAIKQREHWAFRYSWLPGKQRDVYDGGMGRDELYALYKGFTSYSLLIPNQGLAQSSYTVLFAAGSWSDHLILRAGDRWNWSVSFELVQVS